MLYPSRSRLQLVRSAAGKIVIPRTAPHVVQAVPKNPRQDEYERYKKPGPGLSRFIGGSGGAALRQQQQLADFTDAIDGKTADIWRSSKSHVRRQEKLIRDFGVDGAVREQLQPSKVSFHSQLRERPLDRKILEEIYRGLHGKRVERRLKRGVHWEHWIAKGDDSAPIFSTSPKAQRTFAFGGQVGLLASAYHPDQFPMSLHGAKRPLSPRLQKQCSGAASPPVLSVPPEVVFIGRTSSGKSSLVNAVLNCMVAPYGHLQGTTTAVNFYNVAGKVTLVDAPGYGYYHPMQTPALDGQNAVHVLEAYLRAAAAGAHRSSWTAAAPESRRDDAPGTDATSEHFHVGASPVSSSSGSAPTPDTSTVLRRPLKRVFVCVSARGLQEVDRRYLDLLEALAIPFSVVLTKTDEAPVRLLARITDYIRCQLVHYQYCHELMLASALRLSGIDKLQNLIASVALHAPLDPASNAIDFDAIV